MPKVTAKHIHWIYGIVTGAVTVIAGICIMLACYGIYRGGAGTGQIYSRAIVAEAFAPIAVPVYLCLALVIGGFILKIAVPMETSKPIPEKNRGLILARLQAKTDLTQCDTQLQNAIAAQRKRRKTDALTAAAVLAVCSAVFLIYACMPGRWPEPAAVTAAMVEAVLVLFACLALPTGLTIFAAYRSRASLDREIELMKQAAKQAPSEATRVAKKVRPTTPLLITRYALVAIALFLVIFGYCNEGFRDVIAKAAAICTECVGLG